MNDDAENEVFLRLSRVLTGEPRLDPQLACEYHERIERAFPDECDALLAAFGEFQGSDELVSQRVRSEIMDDKDLGAVAREVIMIWYLSGFRGPGDIGELGPETPEQYYQGLLWPTIRAHPLGLSGGYFGYWHYPPEN